MMRFFIILFFLTFQAKVFSQDTGFFRGRVTDDTGEPLIGASIILKSDPTIGSAADLNGFFSISVYPGSHAFVIHYTGMKSDTVTVLIKSGQTIEKNITLTPYVSELKEIEIKVGKFEKNYEEISVSVEIIKADLIESKNTRNIETALDQTPGLNILDGEAQIRGGSGFTFGVGSKVAVFVDEMPLLSGDAGRPIWDLIPIENIDQIEVIKGATSVLSGASALSGAIYIRTKYPGLKPVTRVTTYSGFYSSPQNKEAKWWNDFPYIAGTYLLHSRMIGNLDLVVGANLNLDHGYQGAPKPGPMVIDTVSNFSDKQMRKQRYRFNFNLRYRSKSIQGLNYGVNGNLLHNNTNMALVWLDDTAGFYRAYPGAAILQNITTFYIDPFFNYYTQTGIKHSLKARIFYLDNDMSNNQSNRQTMIIGDYQFRREYAFLNNLEFIGGLISQYTSSDAKMYGGSGSPHNTLFNFSAYTELNHKLFQLINLSYGARLEYFQLNDTLKDTKSIFRIGATIKLLQETNLRASYGQGYRFPTIAERYIRLSMGAIAVFENPYLLPESSWNAEIGIKQGLKFGKYFGYIDIAFFSQEYKNTIEYLFGFWDPNYTFAIAGFKFLNTGKSKITGIDISHTGMAKAGKHGKLRIILGYNYILPKTLEPDYVFAHDYNPGGNTEFSYRSTSIDPSNNILKYRFLHTLKGDIEYNIKNWAFGFSIKYYSKIENLDKAIEDFEKATIQSGGSLQPILYMDYFYNHNNGNVIMDGRISYKFNDRHKIAIIGNNFLNRTYSLRPLKAEEMRTILIQYTLNI
ncbi:MAG: TonB-dependent receptor [Bacteroidales bacterium]|nr:TonB-dependent receptor [Bacteroidales bacterium]